MIQPSVDEDNRISDQNPRGSRAEINQFAKDDLATADAHLLEQARTDPAVFCSYVLKDEETGASIQTAPLQEEWHDAATQHTRVLIWAHIEAGKTQQMSIGRALFDLGINPNLRIVIVSNTDGQAQKIGATIGRYIEHSPELRAVFPNLRRAKKLPWTSHQLTVERQGNPKDPSIRSCGVHGNILGARIDRLIVDDILDYENTNSAHQRDELKRWFQATLEGRLTKNARVLVVGTAWNVDDIMHTWAKNPLWTCLRYPVMDSDGEPTWSARWSRERIEEKRQALGVIEFHRQLMCTARSGNESRFKLEWINQCLARGDGRGVTYALDHVPSGYATFTGVDLGVSVKDGSDVTCIFTIIVHPDETREVLCIEAGRWAGPEIVRRIIQAHYRYHSIVLVENNAAQDFIVQFTKAQSAVPVRAFTTGRNKINPLFGLESLATELANGKWVIPSRGGVATDPEIIKWVSEMLYYDPEAHSGDRLMAAWFAREGARATKPRGRQGALDIVSR